MEKSKARIKSSRTPREFCIQNILIEQQQKNARIKIEYSVFTQFRQSHIGTRTLTQCSVQYNERASLFRTHTHSQFVRVKRQIHTTITHTFAVDVQNATDVLTLLFRAVQSGTAFFQTQKNEEV